MALEPERKSKLGSWWRESKLRSRWEIMVLSPIEEKSPSLYRKDTWAKANEDPLREHDRLWQQYAVLVDVYKVYVDMVWKASVWYYATTGAILAYYFGHVDNPGFTELPTLLIFLAVASLGFSYHHYRGAKHLNQMKIFLEYIATELRLPGRPHVEFIAAFVLINCFIFALVGLASLALFIAA